tara:strand:+ start:9539 stop:10006 length:468 start_codon:yes stop_codon:yes gene_type:complete
MKISILAIGRTDEDAIKTLIDKYSKRLGRFCQFEFKTVADVNRKQPVEQQKKKEAEIFLRHIKKNQHIILLDEKGKMFSSIEFSNWIAKKGVQSESSLIFLIGGPYGFDNSIYQLNHEKVALSKMTFSHQMVRPFIIEQIYRAFSIINRLPYHHH